MKKKPITSAFAVTCILLFSAGPFGRAANQSNAMWQDVDERSLDQNAKRLIVPMAYRTVRLDKGLLAQALANAPPEFTRHPSQNPIISLPMPDGTLARFRYEHSPVVEEGLSGKYPELKATYRAQGIDDPTATCRFDWLPTGFHAIILSPSGTVLIDPYAQGNTTDYISYWKRDAANLAGSFTCDFKNRELAELPDRSEVAPAVTSGATLRTYRLALAATNEYCVAVGGNTVSGSLAAEVLIMNRVNGVYERDLAIHMNIVANNNLITYAGDNMSCGGSCNSSNDPYTNGNGSTMLSQNQTTCNNVIGSGNYDIGHVFSTGGGGIAGLGVVCTSSKAQGVTGQSNPVGDPFAIDYVAHEMGHQFGADHTFNGTSSNCGGGNRSASHSYETGSGITIMAYAGICANQDLGAHSIDTFHLDSLNAIVTYTQSGSGNSCAAQSSTGNTPPTVTGPGNFNIPIQTPFSLTASATDPNGDTITYDWQEFDTGGATGTTAVPNTDSDGTPRPIFRCYSPTSSGTRTFPSLQYILNNANVPPSTSGSCPSGACLTGELLPAITRTMVFQVVARDNRANGGGINSVASTLSVTSTAGPFAVTAPNTGISIPGNSNFTVTWSVANTTAAPVSAANVKISLSTNGGNTFPTTLLASTPNDGSESVLIPNTPTTTARIKVEGVGKIFFDISNTNFTITATSTPTPTPTPRPTPTPTPTSSATPTPPPTPRPTPTPSPTPISTPPQVEAIYLPVSAVGTTVNNFMAAVTVTDIDPNIHGDLQAFQGDFTYDSTVVAFQGSPVSVGDVMTNNGGSWSLAANANLTGTTNAIKTCRVTAFCSNNVGLSTDGAASNTLFKLNLVRVSSTPGANTALTWSAPPDHFRFFDVEGFERVPGSEPPGSITIQEQVSISGAISYCAGSVRPVPNVTMSLSGDMNTSVMSDGTGQYQLSGIPTGGNYSVTPSAADLLPGVDSHGININEALRVQQHINAGFTLLSGCGELAAHCNANNLGNPNASDCLFIQQYVNNNPLPVANLTGQWRFVPGQRTYNNLSGNQSGENYDAYVLGDPLGNVVFPSAAPPVPPQGSQQQNTAPRRHLPQVTNPSPVATVTLQEKSLGTSGSEFVIAVKVSQIDPAVHGPLQAFQGDLMFDSTVVRFQEPVVTTGGLTGRGSWSLAANVLAGKGRIKTLRVTCFTLDNSVLEGSGTLFNLRLSRVGGIKGAGKKGSGLEWALPPHNFVFYDYDGFTRSPLSAPPGELAGDRATTRSR